MVKKMKVKIKRKFVNRQFIKMITIVNEQNFKVTLCDIGASIYSLSFLENHKEKYLTLTPKSIKEFLSSKQYYGKTIGRVCGRIPQGHFKINGKEYYLDTNESKCTLHSGKNSFAFKKFTTQIIKDTHQVNVIFTLNTDHLCDGFPGRLDTQIIYTISDDTQDLDIDYLANTDQATLVNLTTHTYFNLDDCQSDVLDHQLWIDADKVGHMDDNLIISKYENSPEYLNFKKTKFIKDNLFDPALIESSAKGYDHSFLFNEHNWNYSPIILKGRTHTLEIYTTYPSAVIYTCNYPSGCRLINAEKEEQFQGVAIEPQLQADDFKAMTLESKEKYHHQTKYRFK